MQIRNLGHLVAPIVATGVLSACGAQLQALNQNLSAERAQTHPARAIAKTHAKKHGFYYDDQYTGNIQHVIVVVMENRSLNNLFSLYTSPIGQSTQNTTQSATPRSL